MPHIQRPTALALTLATTALLILLPWGLHTKVLPVFLQLMEGYGGSYSRPTTLALYLATWMPLIAPSLGLVSFFLARRARKEGALGVALGAVQFGLAAFLVLQCWIFVDVAIQLPAGLVRARRSAMQAATQAPAQPQAR